MKVQRGKHEVGGRRIRGLKARVGWMCCTSREGARCARLNSRGIRSGKFKLEVTVLIGAGSPEGAGT